MKRSKGVIASESMPPRLMKTFFHFIFVLVVFFIPIHQGKAQPLFEVERESFCKGVQGREPMDPFSGSRAFLHGALRVLKRILKKVVGMYRCWMQTKNLFANLAPEPKPSVPK
jgi:hypothetical protein